MKKNILILIVFLSACAQNSFDKVGQLGNVLQETGRDMQCNSGHCPILSDAEANQQAIKQANDACNQALGMNTNTQEFKACFQDLYPKIYSAKLNSQSIKSLNNISYKCTKTLDIIECKPD